MFIYIKRNILWKDTPASTNHMTTPGGSFWASALPIECRLKISVWSVWIGLDGTDDNRMDAPPTQFADLPDLAIKCIGLLVYHLAKIDDNKDDVDASIGTCKKLRTACSEPIRAYQAKGPTDSILRTYPTFASPIQKLILCRRRINEDTLELEGPTRFVMSQSAPMRPSHVVVPEFCNNEAPHMGAADVFEALEKKACPTALRSLTVEALADAYERDEQEHDELWEMMLESIAEHLPAIEHLSIFFALRTEIRRYDYPLEDRWAALLPRRLTTLHLKETALDSDALNILIADIPSLRELRAFKLFLRINEGEETQPPTPIRSIRSELCRWERLELYEMPSYHTVAAFTVWPAGMTLSWAPGALGIQWVWDNDSLGTSHSAASLAAERLRMSYRGPSGIVMLLREENDEGSLTPLAPLAGIVREVRGLWGAGCVLATSDGDQFVMTDYPMMPCTCG